MTKSTLTILIASGITLVIALLTMSGLIDWVDFVVWVIVVTVSLSIIGYAWHVDKVKRSRGI